MVIASMTNGVAPGELTKPGGFCLEHALPVDSQGNASCVVIEATHASSGQSACMVPGRQPIADHERAALEAAQHDSKAPTGADAWNSFCLISQVIG